MIYHFQGYNNLNTAFKVFMNLFVLAEKCRFFFLLSLRQMNNPLQISPYVYRKQSIQKNKD